MRNDIEKTDFIEGRDFDVSSVFNADGIDISPAVAKQGALLMAMAVKPFNKIVTNRLHVAITAALLGKDVEVYDNSYGKLKAVWNASLKSFSNAAFAC